ncbi:MAG: histidine kinase [Luteolibacter sp.]
MEVERVRIARDMHDVVAHSLAVVVAQADGARYAASTDPDAASRALETIGSTARSALADVRLLLIQLRHSESEGPQPQLTDLEALYTQVRAAGVNLRVAVEPLPVTTPPAAVQLAVYRILQEALTNALRHGDGGTVRVETSTGSPTGSTSSSATPPPLSAMTVPLYRRGGSQAPQPSRRTESGHGLLGMR